MLLRHCGLCLRLCRLSCHIAGLRLNRLHKRRHFFCFQSRHGLHISAVFIHNHFHRLHIRHNLGLRCHQSCRQSLLFRVYVLLALIGMLPICRLNTVSCLWFALP